MDEKTEFSQRLRQAISDAGYEVRPSVLEREFNMRYWGKPITVQAVCRWLNGEAIPAQDKLQVLAEWLNVAPHNLRFGEDALLKVQKRTQRWDEALTGPEREVLAFYLELPAPERKVIREVILAFFTAQKAREQGFGKTDSSSLKQT
jgi:transcriptional regulator with XRE-family HTH domain